MPFSCKPTRTAAAQALVAAMVLLLAPSASSLGAYRKGDTYYQSNLYKQPDKDPLNDLLLVLDAILISSDARLALLASRAQLQIADLKQSNLDKDAKITELEAELASAGLSRYLTITNDDFINLAEVAAFDASGNQLTPVHASMNKEWHTFFSNWHGFGAAKCIDGIANNMCHSQPSDASGLQWLRLDFGSLVRVASVVVTNRVNGFHGRIDGARIQLSVAETSGVVWSDTFFGAAPEYTFVHPAAAAAAAATGTGRRAREESPDLGVEEEPSAKKPAQSAPSLTIRGRPVSN